MNDPRLLAPNPQVLFTEIDDGSGVLLHLDTKFYYTLNPTAVVVWKALRDGKGVDVDAIASRIVADFRVELDVARRDVTVVLDDLLADGLLVAAR
jgi:Coenzyme PQQ synthesis protein D (PqqD)